MEFITLTIVTCIVLIFIVRFSINNRNPNPTRNAKTIGILIALAVLGMLIGKYGATWGFPWWIYFPAPMLIVIISLLVFFKMNKTEALKYVIITIVSGLIIHIVFSLFGRKNYMPFFKFPSIMELIQ
jgi:hypothetical protein